MRISKFLLVLLLIPSVCFGATGASAVFDGTGDYFTYSNFTPVTGSGNREVCVWMIANNSANFLNIIGWGDSDVGTAGEGWRFRVDQTTDALRSEVNSGNEVAVTDVSDGTTWRWVCSSLTGTDITNVAHYINETDNGTASSSARAISTTTDCPDTVIGSQASTSCLVNSTTVYNGNLAHLLVISSALSAVNRAEARWKPEIVAPLSVLYDPMWDGSNVHRDLSPNSRSSSAMTGNVDGSSNGPPVMFGGGLPL